MLNIFYHHFAIPMKFCLFSKKKLIKFDEIFNLDSSLTAVRYLVRWEPTANPPTRFATISIKSHETGYISRRE